MFRIFRQFRKRRAARRIIALGWPLVLGNLSQVIVANTDAVMLGRISLDALAALGVASTVMHFFIIIGNGLSFGMNAAVSSELGTNSHARSGRALLSGLQIGLLTGPLVALLAWVLTPWIYTVMGLEGVVLDSALAYTRIFCGFLLFSPLQAMLNAAFSAYTHTRVVMISSVLMAVLNVMGNYLLIFGAGGFPMLGIEGAAWASMISIAVSTAFLLGVLWMRHRRYHLHQPCTETGFRYYLIRIGSLGMTTVLEWLLWFGGILILNGFVVRCGTAEVALFNVGIKIQSLLMLCMAGTVGVNSAMVSRAVGAQHPKRIRMWTSTSLRVGLLTILPGLFFLIFFPEWVLRIYMRAEDVAQLGHVAWVGWLLAIVTMIRVNNSTVSTTLRCMGMFKCFVLSMIISQAVMLPCAWAAVGVFKLGAAAAIAASVLEEGIRAVLYWRSFRRAQ